MKNNDDIYIKYYTLLRKILKAAYTINIKEMKKQTTNRNKYQNKN
jgi:hypothetical protein